MSRRRALPEESHPTPLSDADPWEHYEPPEDYNDPTTLIANQPGADPEKVESEAASRKFVSDKYGVAKDQLTTRIVTILRRYTTVAVAWPDHEVWCVWNHRIMGGTLSLISSHEMQVKND